MHPIHQEIDSYLAEQRLYRRPAGIDAYRRALGRLVAYAGDRTPTARLTADYLISRAHLAPATLSAEWSAFASFSRWREARGGASLVALLRRPTVPRVPVIQAPALVIQCVAAWIESDQALARSQRYVALCLYAGLRISEARLLCWHDVDEIGRQLTVRQGKGGRCRTVPLAPPLARVLAAVPRAERRGAVAGQAGGAPLSRGGAEHIFDRELERDGIEVTAHMLRRAFATRLDELGVSLRVIQELLGHSSLATTERYIGVDRRRKLCAVALLDGAFSGEEE
jgi:integrase